MSGKQSLSSLARTIVKLRKNRSISGVAGANDEEAAKESSDCGAYKKLYEAYEYAKDRD